MKNLLLLSICITITTSAFAHTHSVFHLPLDLEFTESQDLFKQYKAKNKNNKNSLTTSEPFVRESIQGGEKMSEWLKKINANRSSQNQIRLSSKTNRGNGIPISKPKIYGPKTIKETYLKLKEEMPKVLWDVFFGNKAITNSIPTDEKTFKKWALQTSKNYQTAVRWTMMKKHLPALARRKARDVRGFYFLNKIKNLNAKIANFNRLPVSEKKQIKEALVGICLNTVKVEDQCNIIINNAQRSNSLRKIKDRYWGNAIKNWNSFFKISSPRNDVVWRRSNPRKMFVEFKNPNDNKIADWLQENVEDEFKRSEFNWSIKMNFVEKPIYTGVSHLEFKKGVTPHVSGGNKIVMDANAPIEEYKVKWTIRHEYGHILRIPDCYHEFYDRTKNVMVNYQLDTTDLMCSRSGDMNDRIYFELKEKYYR